MLKFLKIKKIKFLKLIFLGKTYNFKLNEGVLRASDIESIKDANGKPLRSYDPAFMNTICCVNNFFFNYLIIFFILTLIKINIFLLLIIKSFILRN